MTPEEPVLLPLTNGMFATVDRRDYERVAAYKWAIFNDGKSRPCARMQLPYSPERRSNGQYGDYLHRFILGITESWRMVRFRNNDKLICTRENMYIVEHVSRKNQPKRRGPTTRPDLGECSLPSPCGGIVKAREGRRCKQYSKDGWTEPDNCRHYGQCLDACCRAWWPGFVAARDM